MNNETQPDVSDDMPELPEGGLFMRVKITEIPDEAPDDTEVNKK